MKKTEPFVDDTEESIVNQNSFRVLSNSVLSRGRLISYINIYHLFAGRQYIISFSLLFAVAEVFVFGGEI